MIFLLLLLYKCLESTHKQAINCTSRMQNNKQTKSQIEFREKIIFPHSMCKLIYIILILAEYIFPLTCYSYGYGYSDCCTFHHN